MQNPHDPGNCDKGKRAYLQRNSSQIIHGQSGQRDNQEREGTSPPTGVPARQAQHGSQTGLLQEAPILLRVKSSGGQGRTRKRLHLHRKAGREQEAAREPRCQQASLDNSLGAYLQTAACFSEELYFGQRRKV